MDPNESPKPAVEPGGDRMMIIIALIVVSALGGMVWSMISRHKAPPDAPAVKARFLPPSERPGPPSQAATPGTTAPAHAAAASR